MLACAALRAVPVMLQSVCHGAPARLPCGLHSFPTTLFTLPLLSFTIPAVPRRRRARGGGGRQRPAASRHRIAGGAQRRCAGGQQAERLAAGAAVGDHAGKLPAAPILTQGGPEGLCSCSLACQLLLVAIAAATRPVAVLGIPTPPDLLQLCSVHFPHWPTKAPCCSCRPLSSSRLLHASCSW